MGRSIVGLPASELGLRSGRRGRQEEAWSRRAGHPRSGLGSQAGREGRYESEDVLVHNFRARCSPPWVEGRKSFLPWNVPLHLLHAARHRPPAFGLN